MTFLELCQRLVRETGIADTGPSSTVGQTGDMRRIVDWTNDGWLKIQSMRKDWAWMWATGSSTLTANTYLVTLPSTAEDIERVSLGENFLQKLTYDEFADAYRTVEAGEPTAWAIRPDGQLAFNAKPSADKTVTYEYYSVPVSMIENFDAPGMPDQYHMLIVYSALRDYALFDDALELEKKALINYEMMLAALERDQLPKIHAPDCLV
jgi:hypothetical protein